MNDQNRSHVTTHVLDATTGRPAAGIAVFLDEHTDDSWRPLAEGVTDSDGRVARLGPDALPAGAYRITFRTGEYFASNGRETFYPEVTVTFSLTDAATHYHVPLLLSPFAFSTYRGS